MKTKIKEGDNYGYLTVSRRVGNYPKNGEIIWLCSCICGETTKVTSGHLKSGHTASCGCLQRERLSKANIFHGQSKTKEYSIWRGMVQRCKAPKGKAFRNYASKGVKVCDRWLKPEGQGFLNFLEDVGERPKGYEIDRIDPYGNYEPNNCRWVPRTLQAFNRRRSKKNTSGRTGVSIDTKSGKWIAQIKSLPKEKYETFEEAVLAREKMELEHYGEIKKDSP